MRFRLQNNSREGILTMPATLKNLERTRKVIEEGAEAGLHVGVQLHATIDGLVVADDAWGRATGLDAMTTESLMPWLSAGKPVTAVLFGMFWERGLLSPEDRVARYLPEFGVKGKEAITFKQLLTHTGCFPNAPIPKGGHREAIIASLCNAPLEPGWVPGEVAAYHPRSSWYILGEALHRIDSRPFSRIVQNELFDPLDESFWFGMPEPLFEALRTKITRMHYTFGQHSKPHPDFPEHFPKYCSPGSSGHGTARALVRFYEMLLNGGELNGHRYLTPETVAELTRRHRIGMPDRTFGRTIDWGLGFIINSEHHAPGRIPYGFGPYASPESFGHGGNQSSIAFADPACGLALACSFNGMPGELRHQARMRSLLKAVYEDLELVQG